MCGFGLPKVLCHICYDVLWYRVLVIDLCNLLSIVCSWVDFDFWFSGENPRMTHTFCDEDSIRWVKGGQLSWFQCTSGFDFYSERPNRPPFSGCALRAHPRTRDKWILKTSKLRRVQVCALCQTMTLASWVTNSFKTFLQRRLRAMKHRIDQRLGTLQIDLLLNLGVLSPFYTFTQFVRLNTTSRRSSG